ncbi:MAG: hypothetical protein LLG02_07470 [Pelosinus sp.]|nr:hypothetical protein [Pelosinus sp.]
MSLHCNKDSSDLLYDKEFWKYCKKITLDAFKNKIPDTQIDELLKHMPTGCHNHCCGVGGISEVNGADASILSAVVWSKVKCYPDNQPWKFEAQAWGPAVCGGSCAGFMYNFYEPNDWDAFFRNTASFWAQGVSYLGGIFQITWFDSNSKLIGQFNGAMAGVGVFEVANKGHWTKR